MSASKAPKVLAAFHDSVNRADPRSSSTTSDTHAAGPIACFTYIVKVGLQVISVNLVYTKSVGDERKWPEYWEKSPFKSFWCFWRTCKERTLTSATNEMNALNPPGRRQNFATTTIKNDYATLSAVHTAYIDATSLIRPANVEGLSWTLVLQPLVPDWARKGDANRFGLQECTWPLVIVSFTINWANSRDDKFVRSTARRAIEQIDAAAVAKETSHPYRYLNYCTDWQRPFEGYSQENHHFLKGVSRKYDPDDLFQRGCVGGFKLGLEDDET